MHIATAPFTAAQTRFADDFLNREGSRYLYGRTKEAESIARLIKVDGFIDDYTSDASFMGLPCIRLADLPADARVISTIVQARPISALRKLEQKNCSHLDFFAFHRLSGLPFREIPYWAGAKAHFIANRPDYTALHAALADAESRETMEHVLRFRLNHDLREMAGFVLNQKTMYIEPFLRLPGNGAVFFDLGAYDGYNSRQFLETYPDGSTAVLFEPIPQQAAALTANAANDARLSVFSLAVSDFDGPVSFSIDDTASTISKDGSGIACEAIRLDTFCARYQRVPDYIKMDIEGSELKALAGATQTIARHRPNLAISVYHDASHLTQAYKIVSEICPNYKFFLRHYTEGYTETVLFAVPA